MQVNGLVETRDGPLNWYEEFTWVSPSPLS